MSKKIAVYGGIGCLTIIIILFISACTSLIGAQKKAQQKAQELNKTNVVNEETNQNTEQTKNDPIIENKTDISTTETIVQNKVTEQMQQEGKDFFDGMIEVGLITKYEIDSDLDTLWVHMTPGQWNFIDNKRDFVTGLYVTSKEKFGLYDVNVQNYNDFGDVYGYGGPTRIKIY